MNTYARRQIGQSCSFKEISLAIKLRSERQRVKEVYVADVPGVVDGVICVRLL